MGSVPMPAGQHNRSQHACLTSPDACLTSPDAAVKKGCDHIEMDVQPRECSNEACCTYVACTQSNSFPIAADSDKCSDSNAALGKSHDDLLAKSRVGLSGCNHYDDWM